MTFNYAHTFTDPKLDEHKGVQLYVYIITLRENSKGKRGTPMHIY